MINKAHILKICYAFFFTLAHYLFSELLCSTDVRGPNTNYQRNAHLDIAGVLVGRYVLAYAYLK